MAEYGGAEPDMCRAEADCDVKIRGHAHAEKVEPISLRHFMKQCKVERGGLSNRRDTHQPLDRQTKFPATEIDKIIGFGG